MPLRHAIVETNFLYNVFRLPSERRPDAVALFARAQAGEFKLHLPYLCIQEAKHLISKSLPQLLRWCEELKRFHRYCEGQGTARWHFGEVQLLLDSATVEVQQTKDRYRAEIDAFVAAIGDGVIHGTDEVFASLESLALDHELKYNDRLILGSVLVRASQLRARGEAEVYFFSTDIGDLGPTEKRPKLTACYQACGLQFVQGYEPPEAT
jgi:hypothetical protein